MDIVQIALLVILVMVFLAFSAVQVKTFWPPNTKNYGVTLSCLIILAYSIGSIGSTTLNNYISNCLLKLLPQCDSSETEYVQYEYDLDIKTSYTAYKNETLNVMNINVTARTNFPASEVYIAWRDKDGESHTRTMFKRNERTWEHILSTRIDNELSGFIIACAENGQIAVTTLDISE